MLAKAYRHKLSSALPTLEEALTKLTKIEGKISQAAVPPNSSQPVSPYSTADRSRAKSILSKLLPREVSYIQHPSFIIDEES